MKKIYLLLTLLVVSVAGAQIINIPDANFKNALLTAASGNLTALDVNGDAVAIDTNSNMEIEVSEALVIYTLDVRNLNIADLTGIEAFANLTNLTCFGNQLTSLDVTDLLQLTRLNCSLNQLTSLSINGLIYLDSLNCSANQLTSLDVSDATNLNILYCINNQLSSLDVSGFSNLIILQFGSNLLTSINLNGLGNLGLLDATNNLLTAIDFTGAEQIQEVSLFNNQLTSLDVSNLSILQFLDCSANNLATLYAKNGSEETLVFSANPNLNFICVDDSQIQDVQIAVQANSQTAVVSDYCSFTPGGNYNTISGQIKFDADLNGCEDDLAFPYTKVVLNDGSAEFATYTDSEGHYAFYTEAGNFTVGPEFEASGFTINPASSFVNFEDDQNNVSVADFCIAPNGINPDLKVIVSPVGAPIPGFNTTYQVTLRNKGNQTMSQPLGLSCSYDYFQMDYISTNPPADSIDSGTIYWNYGNLMPFETRTFFCTMNIHALTDLYPVNMGDVVQVAASVSSAGDVLPADNDFILNQTAVNSLDPNDILCLEGDSQPTSAIGEYLHYRVRFENTGTAPAQNVVVRLPLNPNQYQVNSLQLLSASHPVIGRVHDNIAEFMFNNLNLDSGGHGNVLLKVRSSDVLQQGDSAISGAGIYFDYNFPVETNNAETVFEDLSTSDPNRDLSIEVYPNPASNQLTIRSASALEKIELYDIQGRLLQASPASGSEFILQLTSYANGNFFLNVVSDQGISVQKIIKK